MIKLKINNQTIEVKEGTSILKAAQSLGIEIPSMCFLEGHHNHPSCMMCVVKDLNSGKLMPSCAMPVSDGMNIMTEDEEIFEARKDTLELLLSDHVGDCEAPCKLSCPAQMDIPLMNRLIVAGKYSDALKVVKEDIALPLVLGYICTAPCENACRRKQIDEAVSICQLKKFVAATDLDSESNYIPPKTDVNHKKVAIIGSGPTGLSAGFYLTQLGHQVELFDQKAAAGGSLFRAVEDGSLPEEILKKEIKYLQEYGIIFNQNQTIGKERLNKLLKNFDAVILCSGAESAHQFDIANMDVDSYQTNVAGVFAAGSIIRSEKMAVRCVAQGKNVAMAVDLYLKNKEFKKDVKKFNSKFGKLRTSEFETYLKEAGTNPKRQETNGTFLPEEAVAEAQRCMHCDCRDLHHCKLRTYATQYRADRKKYLFTERKEIKKIIQQGQVVYEAEKCIRCGLCVDITSKEKELTGLTFIGRGFDVRIQVPFNKPLHEALTTTARKCVEACPTGALSYI